ncbi:UbiA family prenyltransferase [Phycicoccus avicenniae]|uniref:UbiA family prenyltransferase n=1 Tax=Phycicoccus avicenniae TaxID=2828860 RepID=UPI003D2D57E3
MPTARAAAALVRACHPLPTAAVTAFAVALGAGRADLPVSTLITVGLAVLTGQLSIGWSNDAVDAEVDRVAARREKPVVVGAVSPRALWVGAALAAAVCIVASLAVGLLAGSLHLVGVAAGWAYNTRLKRTVLSPLPYAVAFGLLPAFVLLAGPTPTRPGVDLLLAAALLGTAAHLANAAPDVDTDRAVGIDGLPQRLGARRSLRLVPVLVAAAALVLVVGPSRPGAVGVALLAAGGLVALATGRVPVARAFPLTVGAVALVLTGLLLP